MPSFYPSHMQTRYPQPLSDHGPRYKHAAYHGLQDYPTAFRGYQKHARMDNIDPSLQDPYDRYKPVAPQSALYEPPSCYGPRHPDQLPPIGASVLAPLQLNAPAAPSNNRGYYHQEPIYGHAYAPQPKEERPVGGVSATLDYNMEQMTDFVAETAAGIFDLAASHVCVSDIDILRSIRPAPIYPSFRKWTLEVLNATRLPSATLLLSLSYLALRIRYLSATRAFAYSEHGLYKLLTVALILGSKFLDDNTFQNKSWADVSQIPVRELNTEEREWLASFGHRLHYSPRGSDGFDACQDLWQSFQARPLPTAPALHPLDTGVRRERSMNTVTSSGYTNFSSKSHAYGFASDPGYIDNSYPPQSYSPYDHRWYGHNDSPPTAPHSGPHTPEFYGGQQAWTSFDRIPNPQPYPYQLQPLSQPAMPYQYDYGTPQFNYSRYAGWDNHGMACRCETCRQSHPMSARWNCPMVA